MRLQEWFPAPRLLAGSSLLRVGASNANGTGFKEIAASIGDNAPFEYSMELTTDFVENGKISNSIRGNGYSPTPAHTNYALG